MIAYKNRDQTKSKCWSASVMTKGALDQKERCEWKQNTQTIAGTIPHDEIFDQ